MKYFLPQIVAGNPDIAIADQEQIIGGLAVGACKIVHFRVQARCFRADEQARLNLRVFFAQFTNYLECGILRFRHGKNQFEFRIVEQKK